MKPSYFLILFLLSTFSSKANEVNIKLLMGTWYQCENIGNNVIVLNREKCFTELLANSGDRTGKRFFDVITWRFKIGGSYVVSENSKQFKGNWKLNKEHIILNDLIYKVVEINNDRFEESTSITLVRKDYLDLYTTIDSQIRQLKLILNENWQTKIIDSGFTVFYDRAMWVEGYTNYHINDNLPDSISWYSVVGNVYMYNPTNEQVQNRYPKNGILSIEVKFQDKWSPEKVNKVQNRNDILKAKILETPTYKTSDDLFSDYRFWLPLKQTWRERTTMYDYYFERLPYESEKMNYSIFINPGRPFYFAAPQYVDDNDSLYWDKNKNDLENEYQRTIRTVVLALGIEDFKIVN